MDLNVAAGDLRSLLGVLRLRRPGFAATLRDSIRTAQRVSCSPRLAILKGRARRDFAEGAIWTERSLRGDRVCTAYELPG